MLMILQSNNVSQLSQLKHRTNLVRHITIRGKYLFFALVLTKLLTIAN